MAIAQAVEFLEKIVCDEKLQHAIRESYREMLCDIGRQTGLSFTSSELQQALSEEKNRLTDEMLDKIAGGRFSPINTTAPFGENLSDPPRNTTTNYDFIKIL